MSMKSFWITLAVLAATASFAVAQSATDRADLRAEAKALSAELTATAAAAKPAPGGGDTDSFGRNVQFDGLVQSGYVYFQGDCNAFETSNPLGPNDRCVQLNPAPAGTNFDVSDIGQLTIPGRSAHSLLCHWLTPIATYSFNNTTAARSNARFHLSPYVVVESSVLNDPSLIDPTTTLPFNGKLLTGFAAAYQDMQSLDPGQTASRTFSETRVCIAGFLSKQNLIQGYGLTEAQANQVFRHDITLHFGLRGNLALVDMVDGGWVTYGLRVVGD